jgi:predicted dehydrogenase
MSKDIIRIGFIGAGGIVKQRHFPGLRALPGIEFSAVCNSSRDSSDKVAAEYGIKVVLDDWRKLVELPDLDVVWIGTTPYMHADITLAALKAGKHVFCQARMAMNLQEGMAMLAAAREHPDKITMLCPPPNAIKHGKYFASLLKAGKIGRLISFQLNSFGNAWADPMAPAHWRQKKELSGKNILSVGIYGEVLGRWFGQPHRLCAQGQVVFPRRGDLTVEIPDVVQVLGEWPGYLLGSMHWSGVYCDKPTDSLQLYGTDGVLSYDFGIDEIRLLQRGGNDVTPVVVPGEATGAWNVEADFIYAVRNGGRPEPSFETGVNYMRFVEAVNVSMHSHQWVQLESI